MTLLKLASENTRKQGKNTVEHIVNYYVIFNNDQKLPKIQGDTPKGLSQLQRVPHTY